MKQIAEKILQIHRTLEYHQFYEETPRDMVFNLLLDIIKTFPVESEDSREIRNEILKSFRDKV